MSKRRKIIATAVTAGIVAGLLALGAGLASAQPTGHLVHGTSGAADPLGGHPVGSPLPPQN
jgi:hypothetical protein